MARRELSWECRESSCCDWLEEKLTVLVISALLWKQGLSWVVGFGCGGCEGGI